MPNYASAQAGPNPATPVVLVGAPGQPCGFNITGLEPGAGPLLLFNAETPTPTQSSFAFCRILGPTSGDNGITFQVFSASAPTSATVLVQAAEVEDDAHYATVSTLTFASPQVSQFYTDIGRSKFYRVQLSAISGAQAMTVYAQR